MNGVGVGAGAAIEVIPAVRRDEADLVYGDEDKFDLAYDDTDEFELGTDSR